MIISIELLGYLFVPVVSTCQLSSNKMSSLPLSWSTCVENISMFAERAIYVYKIGHVAYFFFNDTNLITIFIIRKVKTKNKI
jgi:hypothetical protein